jgi:hypothetical protein
VPTPLLLSVERSRPDRDQCVETHKHLKMDQCDSCIGCSPTPMPMGASASNDACGRRCAVDDAPSDLQIGIGNSCDPSLTTMEASEAALRCVQQHLRRLHDTNLQIDRHCTQHNHRHTQQPPLAIRPLYQTNRTKSKRLRNNNVSRIFFVLATLLSCCCRGSAANFLHRQHASHEKYTGIIDGDATADVDRATTSSNRHLEEHKAAIEPVVEPISKSLAQGRAWLAQGRLW